MQARRRWPASEPAPRVPSTRAPDATARSPTEKPSLMSTTVAGTSTATHSNRVRLDVTRSHTCSAARPRGGNLRVDAARRRRGARPRTLVRALEEHRAADRSRPFTPLQGFGAECSAISYNL